MRSGRGAPRLSEQVAPEVNILRKPSFNCTVSGDLCTFKISLCTSPPRPSCRGALSPRPPQAHRDSGGQTLTVAEFCKTSHESFRSRADPE
ncbi:hypothetical protein R6Z07M_011259 [Ovis aries]